MTKNIFKILYRDNSEYVCACGTHIHSIKKLSRCPKCKRRVTKKH